MTHPSQRRYPILTDADRTLPVGREFGWLDFLYGVVAPVGCFGMLLASFGGTVTWPLSIYVLICVVAFVVSFARIRKDDAVDALLHGAVIGAALFAMPWAVLATTLAVVFAFGLLLDDLVGASFALLLVVLGSSSAFGAFVYMRRWRRRWPRPGGPRSRLGLRFSGATLPGVACLALWGGLAARADQVEQSVVASPLDVDLEALQLWRVLAPKARWDAIESAHCAARDRTSRRALVAAHVALTGRRPLYAGGSD